CKCKKISDYDYECRCVCSPNLKLESHFIPTGYTKPSFNNKSTNYLKSHNESLNLMWFNDFFENKLKTKNLKNNFSKRKSKKIKLF
ncbi:MAG: hypothetical protein RLZZ546_403, partial [Bacteroidota bacterium]